MDGANTGMHINNSLTSISFFEMIWETGETGFLIITQKIKLILVFQLKFSLLIEISNWIIGLCYSIV
ncbi:MAG: hypothetical protein CMA96_01135 [Euryarchaeota archaeon]|nr:hypothetical protein [Euryarchaeota archaeon]